MFVFLFSYSISSWIFIYFSCLNRILDLDFIFSFVFSRKKSVLKLLRSLNTLHYRSSLTDSTVVFPGESYVYFILIYNPNDFVLVCFFLTCLNNYSFASGLSNSENGMSPLWLCISCFSYWRKFCYLNLKVLR